MNIKVTGIDLAKSVFQICIQQQDGSVASNRKISRAKLLHTVRQLPPGTLIAMEACASSHHWARTFEAEGYQVRLLPAQHVKPFARRQKNDANDALAICEAAFRPKLHPVRVKSIEQQDIKALRCVRSRLIAQRTAMSNQMRALAAEYGVVFPKKLQGLRQALPLALEDAGNGLSPVMRDLLAGLRDDLRLLDRDVADITQQLHTLCRSQTDYRRLCSIPGYGPIVSAAFMSEVGGGEQFSNGRQVGAWLGLVPRQHSSGDKISLGHITKTGSRELRTLLIHGARAVLRHQAKRQNALGHWLRGLVARRGKTKAIVALANKLARIGWAVVYNQVEFNESLACRAS